MKKSKFNISIIEDDKYFNMVFKKRLTQLCKSYNYPRVAFNIQSYYNGDDFLESDIDTLDIAVLDYYLEIDDEGKGVTGLEVLKEIKKASPNCKVILISEQSDVTITAELFKNGIDDYVRKNGMAANRLWSIVEEMIKKEAA